MATAAATLPSPTDFTAPSPQQNLPVITGEMGGSRGLATYGSGPFSQVQDLMNQPAVKKALPVMVIAITLLLFVLAYNLINAPSYRPVLSGLTESDQQMAYDVLKQADYKPVIDSSTGQLTVPNSRYHEARIFLASKGLPRSGQIGMDSLKDQSTMTTSQFMEQVRYNNAQEQELARTIIQIDSIKTARVHLAITKPSVFIRDRTPPKASVVVSPYPGRSVSPTQVQAIIHLIASSVPMLTPDNVTVVDNYGKMLSDSQSDPAMGLTASQNKHKQKIEDLYRQRILEILIPIVGDANVRSQVNINMDFTQNETTSESYDPQKKGGQTRNETSSSATVSNPKEASGVPGTLSNTAPPPPVTTNAVGQPAATSAATTPTRTEQASSKSFELDKTINHTKSAIGGIQRLSASVVVNERAGTLASTDANGVVTPAKPNPYTPEEITRMQELVRGVVGFDEKRTDVVTVVQAKFEPETVIDLSVPWHKDPVAIEAIKSALLGLVFVAFLWVVIKPFISHTLNKDKEAAATLLALQNAPAGATNPDGTPIDPAAPAGDQIAIEEGETLEQMKAKMKPKKSTISMEMLDTANTYDDKVALVRMIVGEDSARVANVFKNMIRKG